MIKKTTKNTEVLTHHAINGAGEAFSCDCMWLLICSSRAAGDVQILWQMWHRVCHTQFVPTDSPPPPPPPAGGETKAGEGDGVLELVFDWGDFRILRSSSPALPLEGGGLLLLFSSFSFSLLGLDLRGDSLDGDDAAAAAAPERFLGLLR